MREETAEAYKIAQFSIYKTLLLFFSLLITVIVLISLTIWSLGRAPSTFLENSTVTIEPGMSVRSIVELFQKEGYVRNSELLHLFLLLEYGTTDIQAGIYTFNEPLSTRGVAQHITEIGPKEPLISVTFPEGMTVGDFARIANKFLPQFNETSFLSYASTYEGKLFPETYFVPKSYTDEQLFDLFVDTYTEKLLPLQDEIRKSTLTEDEVIILASIIEREANSPESMRFVSSVLQNRLAIDMPLQADASIEYILDKPLSELTPDDLKVDSPYNTYLHTGLPPTPIGNPGLTSIGAVLNPEDSDYYYYITDSNGVFHFAKTFTEHKRNIARYLR